MFIGGFIFCNFTQTKIPVVSRDQNAGFRSSVIVFRRRADSREDGATAQNSKTMQKNVRVRNRVRIRAPFTRYLMDSSSVRVIGSQERYVRPALRT